MPPTTEAGRAGALSRALESLPLRIQGLDVSADSVAVPSYPGEPRPTSRVELHGPGHVGKGEHVGFSQTVHREFHERCNALAFSRQGTLGGFAQHLRERRLTPYDRAALEAAAIDLALRQAEQSLADLVQATSRPTRYVVSLATAADPVRAVERAVGETTELMAKIDVDPAWEKPILRGLAESGRIAVLDWKCGGSPFEHTRAYRLVPECYLEDPGPLRPEISAAIADRWSLDAGFTSARAITDGPLPVAANIKPARMGGVLEAIRGIERCADLGIEVYFGGMFEIGVARRQLLSLASLLSPEGPNDIAPIPLSDDPAERPARLSAPGGPGFG